MAISKKEIFKIAKLARLKISEEEAEGFKGDLTSILSYVAQLNELEIAETEPMTHVNFEGTVFRDDQVLSSVDIEKYLNNAPDTSGHFLRVPLIVGGGDES